AVKPVDVVHGVAGGIARIVDAGRERAGVPEHAGAVGLEGRERPARRPDEAVIFEGVVRQIAGHVAGAVDAARPRALELAMAGAGRVERAEPAAFGPLEDVVDPGLVDVEARHGAARIDADAGRFLAAGDIEPGDGAVAVAHEAVEVLAAGRDVAARDL